LQSCCGLKSQDVEKHFKFFRFYQKTTPYGEIFQNSVPEGFIATPIDVLCTNFMKYGRWEIGKIVHCLPDQKFSSHYCMDRAQNLPGSAPENVLLSPPDFIQIGSLSVELYLNA